MPLLFFPDVGLALVAGLFFSRWRWRIGAAALLIAARVVVPPLVPGIEWPRALAVAAALAVGAFLRRDPQWWRIILALLALEIVQALFSDSGVCWETYVADFAAVVGALVVLAFVLRARKKSAG